MHEKLKRLAKTNNRSLNGQILQLLDQAMLDASDERPRALLDELKREQKRTPAWNVTDEAMKRAMREGLP